jgi:hypothetical protein
MVVRPRIRSAALAVALLTSWGVAWSDSETVSQSPNFRLQPSTVDAAGGHATSDSSRLDGSAGQPMTTGAMASQHFVLQSGFWGFMGSSLVPVVLSVGKTVSQSGSVDVTWSGNNAPYTVYRATDCAVIFSNTLTQTSNNAYTDGSAPNSGLACYNVLAAVPGPAKHPESKSP